MAEPTSMVVPLAIAGITGGVAIVAGVDNNAVIASFAGALLFAFFPAKTPIPTRLGMMIGAWVFGYYLGIEIVKRKILDFDSPPLPSFVAAFFCVAVFKLLLIIFDEKGKEWVLKKIGFSSEVPKDD